MKQRYQRGPERITDGFPMWVIWRGKKYYTPPFSLIESWVYDSMAEALDGSSIECDGHTPEGCPSWLLVLEIA